MFAQIATAALNKASATDSFDAGSFYETLTAPMTMAETRQDFAQTQRWGISGSPALLLAHQDALHMLASGYTKTAQLVSAINAVLRA